MSVTDLMKRAQKLAIDNSPAILTSMGVAGTVAAAYLSGRASFEAAEIIMLKEGVEGMAGDTRQMYKERIKLVWRLYIPAAGTAAMAVTAIICANRIGTRRAAAMAAAYSISEKAFSEYKEKIVERIGEKRETSYRDEIAQDEVDERPVSREVIIFGSGDVLCFDKYSTRYFESDVETLKAAQNYINHEINSSYYASLTDLYNRIGLPPTGYSDEVGWNANRLLELQFSTTLSDDKRPCIVIDFNVEPIRGFYRVN